MLSPSTREFLKQAVADEAAALEIARRLDGAAPTSQSAAKALLFSLDHSFDMARRIGQCLDDALAGDARAAAGEELARKLNGAAAVAKAVAKGDKAATAILGLSTPVALESAAAGASRNGTTLELAVNAPSDNDGADVVAEFTGTSGAIVLTITPNDGTNNDDVPVGLTSRELAELINTGLVAGKSIDLTDGSGLRALQSASGGDAVDLAEADGQEAEFAYGADGYDAYFTPAIEAMGGEHMGAATHRALVDAVGDDGAAAELRAAFDAMVDDYQGLI